MLFIALINNAEFGMDVRQYVRQNYMVWQDSVSLVEPDYKGCSLYQGMFGIPGMFVITDGYTYIGSYPIHFKYN